MEHMQGNTKATFSSLPAEIKTMIIKEALHDIGPALACVNPVQLSLLHTSREFWAISQPLVVAQTLWLDYQLCSCISELVTQARLVPISSKIRPTYVPRSDQNTVHNIIKISVCRCTRRQCEYQYRIPYQPTAIIRISRIIGKALAEVRSPMYRIVHSEGLHSEQMSDCVQDATNLMGLLIRTENMILECNCDWTTRSSLNLRPRSDLLGVIHHPTPQFYDLKCILQYSQTALIAHRYFEVVDLFCVAHMDFPEDTGARCACKAHKRRYETFRRVHVLLAALAVRALREILKSDPRQLHAIRHGHLTARAIAGLARLKMCQMEYLKVGERAGALISSAKLVILLAEASTAEDLDKYVGRKELHEALSSFAILALYNEHPPFNWSTLSPAALQARPAANLNIQSRFDLGAAERSTHKIYLEGYIVGLCFAESDHIGDLRCALAEELYRRDVLRWAATVSSRKDGDEL